MRTADRHADKRDHLITKKGVHTVGIGLLSGLQERINSRLELMLQTSCDEPDGFFRIESL